MSILSKLGKKLGLSGQDKQSKEESVTKDVFNLNRPPAEEPIAEAVPATEEQTGSAPAKPSEEPKLEVVAGSASAAVAEPEPALEGDALLLAKLQKQGANLKVPRHAMFFLYFPTEEKAKIAQNALGYHPMAQATGFQVTVDLTPSEAGWLCLLQLDLIVNELSLKHVRLDLEALAAQLGGHFEGWEASLQAA